MVGRLLLVSILFLGLLAAQPASAAPFADSIPLPVDFQPEGIAVGTVHVGGVVGRF